MQAGETVLSGAEHPGTELQVMKSPAGFYLGFKTKTGEPYSRESGYMTEAQADALVLQFRR